MHYLNRATFFFQLLKCVYKIVNLCLQIITRINLVDERTYLPKRIVRELFINEIGNSREMRQHFIVKIVTALIAFLWF